MQAWPCNGCENFKKKTFLIDIQPQKKYNKNVIVFTLLLFFVGCVLNMERKILKQLLKWKNSPYRKPLILKGVRQVGKTWILKEFGKRYYDNTAYFNFDEDEEYRQFF